MRSSSRRSTLLAVAALCASACGGGAWTGTWEGSCTVNTGRQPVTYTGSLELSEVGGQVQVRSRAVSGSQTFTGALLTAATTADTRATFGSASSCELTAAPADTCAYVATLNSAELTRTGDSLEGTAQGRMTITCTGPGGSISDFSMTLAAKRK